MTDTEGEFNSISQLLEKANEINYDGGIGAFVREIYKLSRTHVESGISLGKSLAAIFDLAVTATYMEKLSLENWYFCSGGNHEKLVFPFVNVCPTCVLEGNFYYVKSGKPPSAKIGKATSVILAALLDMQAKYLKGSEYRVCTIDDNGLVDACLIGPKRIGLFEIKSAPLIAFPLMAKPAEGAAGVGGQNNISASIPHAKTSVPGGVDGYLIIDEDINIPVGDPHDFQTGSHFKQITEWMTVEENFRNFVESWTKTFNGYAVPALRRNTFWLTNGCGAPTPRPDGWPTRGRGSSGYESISDGKSSVGMDRTDDVKKGIYQVLKISTHYKAFFPSMDWEVSAALVSNIHAVKHHKDYLAELEDLVWAVDGSDRSDVVERDEDHVLIDSSKLHNLFDGIIAFTKSYFRDDFLREIYSFDV